MFSKKIIQSSIKTNGLFLCVIILCVAVSIISLTALYPSITQDSSYSDLLKVIPQEMLKALGMQGDMTNLNEYLNMNYYNSIHLYIMIVFVVIFSTKLVAKLIGDTSLVYYLNSSVSRKTFLRSQMVTFYLGLLFILLSSISCGLLSKIIFANNVNIDIYYFIKINVTIIALFSFLGSMCLFISSFAKNGSESIAYGATLVIFQYIVDMFRKMSSQLEGAKYITVFTLYNTEKINNSHSYFIVSSLILVAVSIFICAGSLVYFNKRDLYL